MYIKVNRGYVFIACASRYAQCGIVQAVCIRTYSIRGRLPLLSLHLSKYSLYSTSALPPLSLSVIHKYTSSPRSLKVRVTVLNSLLSPSQAPLALTQKRLELETLHRHIPRGAEHIHEVIGLARPDYHVIQAATRAVQDVAPLVARERLLG